MDAVPEQLHTERLFLRRPTRADMRDIFTRYASDPEVTRYLAWPRHLSVADTKLFLDFSDAEWTRYGCGPYLARSRGSGQLLGSTGLTLSQHASAETGYVFARDAWGYGYATECLSGMVNLARDIGIQTLRAHCHPDHHASAHVLEKCGFVLERRTPDAQLYPNLGPHRRDVLTYSLVVGRWPLAVSP